MRSTTSREDSAPLLPTTQEEARSYGAAANVQCRSGVGARFTNEFLESRLTIPMTITLLAFVFVLTAYPRIYTSGAQVSDAAVPAEGFQEHLRPIPREIQNLWGAYTPYMPVERYRSPPKGCKIDQVDILQRHGARYPTSGSDVRIRTAVDKILSATEYADDRLAFLKNYTYSLGVGDLIPFGAYQSAESGAVTYSRYHKLVSKGNIPFVRASGSPRVVDSATNWTKGFAEANSNIFEPKLMVVLNESLNDTLQDGMCPSAGTPDKFTSIWASTFAPPIAARLNAHAPGANLTNDDAVALMSLCAFESVSKEQLSPWCGVFSRKEFEGYEYWSDLEKYYNRGNGQALGPVQGVGYINELLARLTNSPVRDNTQTNRTLTSSPVTFPLDKKIYVDFSHDNLIVAVLSAMGLYKQEGGHLNPEVMDRRRTWVASRITPFSGRVVVERMECRGVEKGRTKDVDEVGPLSKDTFVRVLVNDAIQPMPFCGSDEHGLCSLRDFVKSQKYARHDGEGDFEKCFEEVPEDD